MTANGARIVHFFRRVFADYRGTVCEDRCLESVVAIAAYEWVDIPLGPIPDERLWRWRGGREHQELCERISWWLTGAGIDWVPDGSPETHYRGGRADLAARDGSLFVEVGKTPPNRVFQAMIYEQPMLLVAFHWEYPAVAAEAMRLRIVHVAAAARHREEYLLDERRRETNVISPQRRRENAASKEDHRGET